MKHLSVCLLAQILGCFLFLCSNETNPADSTKGYLAIKISGSIIGNIQNTRSLKITTAMYYDSSETFEGKEVSLQKINDTICFFTYDAIVDTSSLKYIPVVVKAVDSLSRTIGFHAEKHPLGNNVIYIGSIRVTSAYPVVQLTAKDKQLDINDIISVYMGDSVSLTAIASIVSGKIKWHAWNCKENSDFSYTQRTDTTIRVDFHGTRTYLFWTTNDYGLSSYDSVKINSLSAKVAIQLPGPITRNYGDTLTIHLEKNLLYPADVKWFWNFSGVNKDYNFKPTLKLDTLITLDFIGMRWIYLKTYMDSSYYSVDSMLLTANSLDSLITISGTDTILTKIGFTFNFNSNLLYLSPKVKSCSLSFNFSDKSDSAFLPLSTLDTPIVINFDGRRWVYLKIANNPNKEFFALDSFYIISKPDSVTGLKIDSNFARSGYISWNKSKSKCFKSYCLKILNGSNSIYDTNITNKEDTSYIIKYDLANSYTGNKLFVNVINSYNDSSKYAWTGADPVSAWKTYSGICATEPNCFIRNDNLYILGGTIERQGYTNLKNKVLNLSTFQISDLPNLPLTVPSDPNATYYSQYIAQTFVTTSEHAYIFSGKKILWKFDLNSEKWTTVNDSGTQQIVTIFPWGSSLCCLGQVGNLDSSFGVYKWNGQVEKWDMVVSADKSFKGTSSFVNNSIVYFVGGSSDSTPSIKFRSLNLETLQWNELQRLLLPVSNAKLHFYDNRILCFSGSKVQIYNVNSNSWKSGADFLYGTMYKFIGIDNMVYGTFESTLKIGRSGGPCEGSDPFCSADVGVASYNILTDIWENIAPPLIGLYQNFGFTANSKNVFIVGGSGANTGSCTSSICVYNSTLDK